MYVLSFDINPARSTSIGPPGKPGTLCTLYSDFRNSTRSSFSCSLNASCLTVL